MNYQRSATELWLAHAFASPQHYFGGLNLHEAIAAILIAGRVLEEGDAVHSVALTHVTDLLAAGGSGATKNGGGGGVSCDGQDGQAESQSDELHRTLHSLARVSPGWIPGHGAVG